MDTTKVLLLRYSDRHGVDTIAAHLEVIASDGFCWWAKIGKQPGGKYVEDFFKQDSPIIFLYTTGKLHRCTIKKEILRVRPNDHFPKYYIEDIFGTDIEPSFYFCLSSIEEIDPSILKDYIVSSSEKEVVHDLKKTISSYMFVQHKDAPRVPPKKTKRRSSTQKRINTSINDCHYRKNNLCTNHRSINYLYECLHPSICLHQRIQ